MVEQEFWSDTEWGFAAIREWWQNLPDTRKGSLINLTVRLLLSPVLLLGALCQLPSRIFLVEPRDYGVQKGTSKIFVSRLAACHRESWTLLTESVLYYILLDFIALLGLQHVLRQFRPEIELYSAAFTGTWYTSQDGLQHPLSLLNAADKGYDVRPSARPGSHSAECPHAEEKSGPLDCPCRAHFFSVCAKLIYETPPVVQDILQHRLGMTMVAYQDVPAELHRRRPYVPDMVWFAASTSDSLVVCMKGADVFLKIDRDTDIPIAMTEFPGAGKLLDGFLRGLQQPDPASTSGGTIFSSLESLLQQEGKGKHVFLTGHSLGGAIIITFLQVLAVKNADLAKSVSGVFTFGSPRFGDQVFCDVLSKRLEGRLFRYVHAADMVCKLPPGLGFSSHDGERFITSFPVKHPRSRVLKEEEEPKLVQQWERAEGRFAYLFTLGKLILSPVQEGWLRFGFRLSMCALPGLSDHFPSEYERALRDEMLYGSAAAKTTEAIKVLAACV